MTEGKNITVGNNLNHSACFVSSPIIIIIIVKQPYWGRGWGIFEATPPPTPQKRKKSKAPSKTKILMRILRRPLIVDQINSAYNEEATGAMQNFVVKQFQNFSVICCC